MTEFRCCEWDEKEIILKAMDAVNKEKRQNVLLGIAIYSFLFVFLLLFFVGVYYEENTSDIKRFNGGRPQFEDYETYIMSSIYPSETNFSSLLNDDNLQTLDKIDMYTYLLFQDVYTTYSLKINPEDYDYSKLDFEIIDRRSYSIPYEKPKNSAEYDRIAAEVKTLFDKEIDYRVAFSKKVFVKELYVCIPLVILWVLGSVLIYSWIKKACERRIDEIKNGRALVAKSVLFGRERIHRYRHSSVLYVEAETEDGEKHELRVNSLQYEAYETGKPCFLIKYADEYATYDEFDIVWDGVE